MAERVQIAVCGPGEATAELQALAEEVGRRLAEAGTAVVCGGLGGVMDAVARGAAEADGDVIGMLPGSDRREAGPHVTHAVATGLGQARNLAVVASADAVIAVGGSWGTLSEIALARRLARPVVCLRSWSVEPGDGSPTGIAVASDPAEAVAEALAAASR